MILKADMKNYIPLETAAIFFSCEPISKTGYWIDVCYGWFHLHGLTRAARSENRELQNEKFLPIPGLDKMICFHKNVLPSHTRTYLGTDIGKNAF